MGILGIKSMISKMTMFSTGSSERTQMRKVSRNLKIGTTEPFGQKHRGRGWGRE